MNFYNYLWRFYVLNKELEEEYALNLKNKGDNLKSVGHPCFDPYLNWEKPEESELNYVIYAPHWTVGGDTELNYATFEWTGHFMLEFAMQHPEYTWVFKPHPALKGKLIDSEIMSKDEVDKYYNEWNKVGICYEGPDYFKYFAKARCMITDCGSFLAEFMPTQRPLILLHSGFALPYNFLARKVTQYYYQVKNMRELREKLDKILLKNLDPWKERRLESLRNLKLVRNASENIIQDLKSELKI